MSSYPEHDRLAKVAEKSQACGEFVEWLSGQGLQLGQWYDHRFAPATYDIQALLAEFFEIDAKKIEKEKRKMLDDVRALRL